MTFEDLMAEMRDTTTVKGRNYARYSRAMDIRRAVLKHTMRRIPLIGNIVATFWDGVVGEHPLGPIVDPMGGMWSLQYEYLGDYIFWHKPMTEDYFESPLSRVPWPRRLHVHMAPCRPFWKSEDGTRHEAAERCTRR